jgi:hypothetical protein
MRKVINMAGGLKIKCTECGDVIQSMYRHDFVKCSCRETFVDGGDVYTHCGGKFEKDKDGNPVTF